MNSRVAVKLVPLSNDPNVANDVFEEARRGATLSHHHLVHTTDFGIERNLWGDGRSYAVIVMDYIDGMSLKDILYPIERSGAPLLDMDVLTAIANAMVAALEFAHGKGLLHLDIKPENVMIDKNGLVRVLDFGAAAIANIPTLNIARQGTIGYMPPEQMLWPREVDVTSDEWAFASTVNEMLVGENPFLAPNLQEALQKANWQALDSPEDARGISSELNGELDAVIYKALQPTPADRYASVAEFWDELKPALGGNVDEGVKKLKEIVNGTYAEQIAPDPDEMRPLSTWERLSESAAGAVACGGVSAVASAWMVFVGLYSSGIQTWAMGVIALAVGAVAAFVPQLGGAMALAVLAVGAALGGAYLTAVEILIVDIAWCMFVASRGKAQSALTLAAPLLGIAHVPCLAALLAGFFLRGRDAWIVALFGGLVVLAMAPLTGSSSMWALGAFPVAADSVIGLSPSYLAMFMAPGTWLTIASWAIAALAMGALCSRETRASAFIGLVLAALAMTFGQILAQWLVSGGVLGLLQPATTRLIALSSILVAVMCFLGPPLRSPCEDMSEADDQGAWRLS